MSVLGIAGSSLFSYLTQHSQSKGQQFKQEFQQLGQDLQSGNLSAAQSDLATLQQNGAQSNSSSSSQSSSPIGQAFSQLSKDLQSGNLSAAQQDYSTIQQEFQNRPAQSQSAQGHHHHHHHASGSDSNSASSSSALSQLLNELGSALQSGNLSSAQQAYSSLQQDLLQFTQSTGVTSSSTSSPSSSSGISVNA